MKIRTLLLTASAVALFAGCSKDENSPQEGGGTTTVPTGATGTMNVSLKYAIETRADDGYLVGEPTESNVQDLTIYFFDSEKKYLGTGDAPALNQQPGNDPEGNIEKKVTAVNVPADVVQELYNDEEAGDGATAKTMYVVAVLNKGDFAPALTVGDPYDKFNAAVALDITKAAADNNFLMTSSNYLDNDGTEMALTPITKKHIGIKSGSTNKAPEEDVKIAVERVVAKVTVTGKEDLRITGWGLSTTNKKLYPVKSFGGDKFLDELSSAGKYKDWQPYKDGVWNNLSHRRSHWAVDPNYNTKPAEEFEQFSFDNPYKKVQGIQYCFENTTDETNQTRDATTSAVIVAQYFPKDLGEDFSDTWIEWKGLAFTQNDFVKQAIIDADGGTHAITTYYKEDTNGSVTIGETKYSALTEKDFEFTYKGDDAVEIKFGGETGPTIGYQNAKANVELKQEITTLYTIEGDVATDVTATATDAIEKAITAALGKYLAAVYYEGYCYYVVPIRHFNDTEVAKYDGPESDKAVYKPEHLGRYGIVRNNFYTITVNKITTPGAVITKPEVDPGIDPDDEIRYSIDVSIDVLSWKIRNQEVDL